jgi:hypothetical protein
MENLGNRFIRKQGIATDQFPLYGAADDFTYRRSYILQRSGPFPDGTVAEILTLIDGRGDAPLFRYRILVGADGSGSWGFHFNASFPFNGPRWSGARFDEGKLAHIRGLLFHKSSLLT